MISEKEINDIFSEGYTKGYADANKRIKERDNNIIKELEKWIKENIKTNYIDNGFQMIDLFDLLNKLEELKEGK